MVLEKTLENPFDSKKIQSILKEISPEFSLERLRAEEKGATEDKMVEWHH